MTRISRYAIGRAAIALVLVGLPIWGAQPQNEASTAPVPALIVSAKSVFISNAGGGCSPFGQMGFSGGPNRPYNQFYAAFKGWGRYQLAAAPAEADLAFEISFICPAAGVDVSSGNSLGPYYDPQLRLAILDVKTRITLWVITQHVQLALTQGNRDKNFDRAMNDLVQELKQLAAGLPNL